MNNESEIKKQAEVSPLENGHNGTDTLTLINKTTECDKSLKQIKMEALVKEFLECIGSEHLNEEVMANTPRRFAEAMIELTRGYTTCMDKVVKAAVFDNDGFDDLILVRDIQFSSLCEHHLMPYFGTVTIGYIPDKKIMGLSKFPRLVNAVSNKLGLQERLTKEIATTVETYTGARGVIVYISSQHSCMSFRGIRCTNSSTNSIFTTGVMKEKDNIDKFFLLKDSK